jgi:hypothetical protein
LLYKKTGIAAQLIATSEVLTGNNFAGKELINNS